MVFCSGGRCSIYNLFGLLWILLASHQFLSCTNSSKQAFSRADRDDCRSIRQVSSAQRWGVLLMAFGKSLIYCILGKVRDQVWILEEHQY